MLKFQKFGHPPASPSYRPRFLGLWAKTQNSVPIIFHLILHFPKRYGTTPVPQNSGRIYIWQKTPFSGRRAWPRGLWGPNHLPKNYLQGVKWALKILRRSAQRFNSYSNFSQWRTDVHTNTQKQTASQPLFSFVWGRRRAYMNRMKFLPLHFVKNNKKTISLKYLTSGNWK